MLNYLLQRLATIVPTLFFVSILIFGLQQLLPGDPAIASAGSPGRSCCSPKISTDTRKSVGRIAERRFARNASIAARQLKRRP